MSKFRAMYSPHARTTFYKALLSAVFAGIAVTVLCLGYDIAYRDETGFSLSDFINVSSLIFIVNIIFLVIGIVYSFLVKAFRKADLVFEIIFLLLILLAICATLGVQRSPIHAETVQFRELLIGILVILAIGVGAIPILFHNKKFEETVL